MWPHSSYGGYARKANRVDWIMYDDLHRYWQGQIGGKSPQTAYRQYVQAGLGEADNPLKEAWREWALGSAAFINRTLALAASGDEPQRQRTSRRFNAVTVSEIIAATAAHHGVEPAKYIGFGTVQPGVSWLHCYVIAGRENRYRHYRNTLGLLIPTVRQI